MRKNEIYVDKTKVRENLRSAVEEFLANGGAIKHVEPNKNNAKYFGRKKLSKDIAGTSRLGFHTSSVGV
jgi:hypothetical protein